MCKLMSSLTNQPILNPKDEFQWSEDSLAVKEGTVFSRENKFIFSHIMLP